MDPRETSWYASGWWRHDLVTDDLAACAARFPTKPASVTYSAEGEHGWEERVTFAELQQIVDAIADGLLELGVAPGEVVCHQLPNWWYFTAIHLACIRIGAVSCPLLPILREREVGYMVAHTGARVLVVPRRFRGFDHTAMGERLVRAGTGLEHVFTVNGPRSEGGSFADFFLDRTVDAQGLARLESRRPAPSAVAAIQFTSGTTGEPKGVMHTHNSLRATTGVVPWALELDRDDVVVMPSPLAHASGFLYGVLMPITLGMTVAYQDRWSADRMLEIIDAESGTWSVGSPPYVLDLIEACRRRSRTAGSLRLFSCAGAPIPRHLVTELRDVAGTTMVPMWGLTETGAVTTTPLAHLDRAADSDGRPTPVMEAAIADEHGELQPPNTTGRLLVRGASMFAGYYRRADLTAQVVDDRGWLDTGDLATIDTEGFVTLTGRVKDIVIRGGENIPVVEVEDALFQHPDVKDVAVVGVPDERLGERACAVVVPVDGREPDLDGLADFLRDRGFATQFLPERIEIVGEIPRTAAGKVRKFVIQEQLARHGSRKP